MLFIKNFKSRPLAILAVFFFLGLNPFSSSCWVVDWIEKPKWTHLFNYYFSFFPPSQNYPQIGEDYVPLSIALVARKHGHGKMPHVSMQEGFFIQPSTIWNLNQDQSLSLSLSLALELWSFSSLSPIWWICT